MGQTDLKRHYEVVVIIHPDFSDQVTEVIARYSQIIEEHNGKIHRSEDSGRRRLAYPINKVYKGHYVVMNIECDQEAKEKLEYQFKYSDLILRTLITKTEAPETGDSSLLKTSDSGNIDRFSCGQETGIVDYKT